MSGLAPVLIPLSYLTASALFILGWRDLAHPRTAVRGNTLGTAGMAVAVAATLLDRRILGYEMIAAGLVAGSVAGALLAQTIRMTAMPQMVALLNGFGGGASVLVAWTADIEARLAGWTPSGTVLVASVASGFIGSVTFWGSLVAFGKLQGLISERQIRFRGHQVWNAALAAVALGLGAWSVAEPAIGLLFPAIVAVSGVLGVFLVLPIGGADMPVVIALLNSYSGLAAAATGFVLDNNGLIIAGSLVGASGVILTRIMCRAMNRSLASVAFGVLGPAEGQRAAADVYEGRVKATSAEEVAMLLEGPRRVVIVPGYGMAVSQAQHAVRDLANLLAQRGTEVEFGIHPVAGRMPGHMNVLLAEANIPYEKLKEMDEVNPTFAQTGVALVIGANDVVNPMARTGAHCPIAGRPILDVDRARTVVVIKRSLAPGFAGIPNPLFAADNALMVFGDGRQAVLEIVAALKEE